MGLLGRADISELGWQQTRRRIAIAACQNEQKGKITNQVFTAIQRNLNAPFSLKSGNWVS
jgi:hypothetical protein